MEYSIFSFRLYSITPSIHLSLQLKAHFKPLLSQFTRSSSFLSVSLLPVNFYSLLRYFNSFSTHTHAHTSSSSHSLRGFRKTPFFFFFFCHFKNLGYIPARSQFRLAPVEYVSPLLFFPSGFPCFSFLSLFLSLFRPVLLCETSIFTRLRETANLLQLLLKPSFFFPHPSVPFAASNTSTRPSSRRINLIVDAPERLHTNVFF